MKKIANKILDFIYFAGIFLVLYWVFVMLLNKLVYGNQARLRWEEEYGILFSMLQTHAYYIAPLKSFIIASLISGVIQASYRVKRFLWARMLVFIAAFWLIDSIILSIQSSFWDFYPTREHDFTAPALAIGITTLIISWIGIIRQEREGIRKVYCMHCGKEISYHEYKCCGLCDRCAECSCVA